MADYPIRLIELRFVRGSELNPNKLNWRHHPKKQHDAMTDVLKKVGWVQCALYNRRTGWDTQGKLIDGHLRRAIAADDLIPVLDVDLSPEEEKLVLATLDPLAGMAEAEKTALEGLLAALKKEDESLAGLLNAIAEDNAIMLGGGDGVPDPMPQIDKAKELMAVWGTERGQIWVIDGKHRVMCGDSTNGDDVARLMDGKRAELLFTSPPYADMRDYMGDVDLDPQTLKSFIRVYKPFCAYQVVNLGIKRKNHAVVPYWDEYIHEAREAGLKLLSWNVWDRGASTSVASETAFFSIEHEWLFVFGEKPKDLNRTIPISENTPNKRKYYRMDEQGRPSVPVRQADGSMAYTSRGAMTDYKKLGTVIYATPAKDRTELLSIHPARFSVGLVIPHLEAMTNESDICIDPFLGSGTTLIACAQTGRVCYGMEIAPEYVAVVLERAKDAGMSCELIHPTPSPSPLRGEGDKPLSDDEKIG